MKKFLFAVLFLATFFGVADFAMASNCLSQDASQRIFLLKINSKYNLKDEKVFADIKDKLNSKSIATHAVFEEQNLLVAYSELGDDVDVAILDAENVVPSKGYCNYYYMTAFNPNDPQYPAQGFNKSINYDGDDIGLNISKAWDLTEKLVLDDENVTKPRIIPRQLTMAVVDTAIDYPIEGDEIKFDGELSDSIYRFRDGKNNCKDFNGRPITCGKNFVNLNPLINPFLDSWEAVGAPETNTLFSMPKPHLSEMLKTIGGTINNGQEKAGINNIAVKKAKNKANLLKMMIVHVGENLSPESPQSHSLNLTSADIIAGLYFSKNNGAKLINLSLFTQEKDEMVREAGQIITKNDIAIFTPYTNEALCPNNNSKIFCIGNLLVQKEDSYSNSNIPIADADLSDDLNVAMIYGNDSEATAVACGSYAHLYRFKKDNSANNLRCLLEANAGYMFEGVMTEGNGKRHKFINLAKAIKFNGDYESCQKALKKRGKIKTPKPIIKDVVVTRTERGKYEFSIKANIPGQRNYFYTLSFKGQGGGAKQLPLSWELITSGQESKEDIEFKQKINIPPDERNIALFEKSIICWKARSSLTGSIDSADSDEFCRRIGDVLPVLKEFKVRIEYNAAYQKTLIDTANEDHSMVSLELIAPDLSIKKAKIKVTAQNIWDFAEGTCYPSESARQRLEGTGKGSSMPRVTLFEGEVNFVDGKFANGSFDSSGKTDGFRKNLNPLTSYSYIEVTIIPITGKEGIAAKEQVFAEVISFYQDKELRATYFDGVYLVSNTPKIIGYELLGYIEPDEEYGVAGGYASPEIVWHRKTNNNVEPSGNMMVLTLDLHEDIICKDTLPDDNVTNGELPTRCAKVGSPFKVLFKEKYYDESSGEIPRAARRYIINFKNNPVAGRFDVDPYPDSFFLVYNRSNMPLIYPFFSDRLTESEDENRWGSEECKFPSRFKGLIGEIEIVQDKKITISKKSLLKPQLSSSKITMLSANCDDKGSQFKAKIDGLEQSKIINQWFEVATSGEQAKNAKVSGTFSNKQEFFFWSDAVFLPSQSPYCITAGIKDKQGNTYRSAPFCLTPENDITK